MAFPLFPSLSAVSARLLNRLLRRQGWAQDYLRDHAGKVVRMQVPNWTLTLRVQADGLTQALAASAPADVVLTLAQDNLGAAFEAIRQHEPERLSALLHIEGEAALAQAVLTLAQSLRWDAEDELARMVGDKAAVALAGVARQAGQGIKQSGVRLAENVAEYLSHENPLLLARPAFEDWAAQVQALSQQLDALESVLRTFAPTASRPGQQPC